jgi:hypothetical protein
LSPCRLICKKQNGSDCCQERYSHSQTPLFITQHLDPRWG